MLHYAVSEVLDMIGAISGVGSNPYTYSAYAVQRQAGQQIQPARQAQTAQSGNGWAIQRRSALETPVQPVTPARPVTTEEASIPALMSRMENDPAAMAGRMRIQYGDVTPEGQFVTAEQNAVQGPELAALEGRLDKAEAELANSPQKPLNNVTKDAAKQPETAAQAAEKADDETADNGVQGAQKAVEEGECQTCKERKYQDGSDDPGVSFKTPTNIAPEQAASAVRGHEMEHVVREQAKAQREDRKVVSQTVTMHTAICPECGKAYVSGGTTRTTTKANPQVEEAQKTEEDNQNRTPFTAAA